MKKTFVSLIILFISFPVLAVGEQGVWHEDDNFSIWSLFTPVFILIGLAILAWWDREDKS